MMAERRGFTLIESLLSLIIFLILVLAGLESFGTARRVFFRLQDLQEKRMTALAALDKIKTDILLAGGGLAVPGKSGLVAGAVREADGWAFWNAEKTVSLAGSLKAGQSFIAVSGMSEVASGRSVCISDESRGEIATVAASDAAGLTLSSLLAHDYAAGPPVLILLRRVAITHDPAASVVRRKVNSTSSQPLLEGVSTFSLEFDAASSLAVIRFRLDGVREVSYETTILAKNLVLAQKS